MAKDKDHRTGRGAGRSKPSFDKGIEQLEAILDEIESGEVPLEQCLKQYEQGVKLVEHCRSILDQAQQRIVELAPTQPSEAPPEPPPEPPPAAPSGVDPDIASAPPPGQSRPAADDDSDSDRLLADDLLPGDE